MRNQGTQPTLIAELCGRGVRYLDQQLPVGGSSANHFHDDWELVLLLDGAMEEVRREGTVQRRPQSLSLFPAGQTHRLSAADRTRWFEIRIEHEWLVRNGVEPHLFSTPRDFQKGAPAWLAQRLYREFRSQDALSILVLEGLLIELLVETHRSATPSDPARIPRWLTQATEYIRAAVSENITTGDLASVARVHPSHLARGFRQHYSCTPGEYVRHLRLEYACRLLRTTELPLAEVALESGFSHQSHLCKVFKEQTSMTPLEFRRRSAADARIGQKRESDERLR